MNDDELRDLGFQAALDRFAASSHMWTDFVRVVRETFLRAGVSPEAADQLTVSYIRRHLFKEGQ